MVLRAFLQQKKEGDIRPHSRSHPHQNSCGFINVGEGAILQPLWPRTLYMVEVFSALLLPTPTIFLVCWNMYIGQRVEITGSHQIMNDFGNYKSNEKNNYIWSCAVLWANKLYCGNLIIFGICLLREELIRYKEANPPHSPVQARSSKLSVYIPTSTILSQGHWALRHPWSHRCWHFSDGSMRLLHQAII